MLLLIAAITAGAVVLAGQGTAFWLCVPAGLLAAARSRTRSGAALSAAAVAGAAALPAVIDHRSLPPAALAVLVPLLSVAVLVGLRERLARERDALRQSALTDPLTGIANRRSLLTRIDYEIARHARTRHGFAVVMIDLDGFKSLNDRFGHLAGDDLLRDVAQALQHTIRAQDTVARIGGDEFCVLAPETEEPGIHRLQMRVERAVTTVTAGVHTLRASVGLARFPNDGRTPQELLAAADDRLLSAKRALGPSRTRRRAA
ncbi:MAG TPA: GGDEF domain-containing protein [Solirubrobacteraceae bacterium]|nr:GGDEF domain-containing protein [Solirubrobacteraceae bacterium]